MSTAVLGIGSNLGDRRAHLQSAVDALRPWLVAASEVYETPPWGPVEQPAYLNAVLIVTDPTAEADDWLDRAHRAEAAAGRTRDVRWGPRSLDVDVLSVDEQVRVDPSLTLPHPRAAQRAFVLVPWLALDPQARLPGVGPVADLLVRLPASEVADVVARPDLALAR
jgi:2-amino-4-hydroxy-6-hydroxymethyldihydropteridine diphosphokinase